MELRRRFLAYLRGMDLGYALVDFGKGRKLERFGSVLLDRPEVLAMNESPSSPEAWKKADARYHEGKPGSVGKWEYLNEIPEEWECRFNAGADQFKVLISPGKHKHPGVFPEQADHWAMLNEICSPETRMLNLFAYTGASSIVAAEKGARVFHVDSSASIIKTARKNAALNGVDSIHWIVEDAPKFVEREVKRKKKYEIILLDPPIFGFGSKNSRWKLLNDLPPLLGNLRKLLLPGGMIILNTYSPQLELDQMAFLLEESGFAVIEKDYLRISGPGGKFLNMSRFVKGNIGDSA